MSIKNNSLVQATKINRFLAVTIAINLIVYTFLLKNSGVILGVAWAKLIGYIVFSEIILKISQNPTLNTEKIYSKIFNFNITLTFSFLFATAFLSGNKEYLFLCIIPVFLGVLEKKTSFSNMILITGVFATLLADLFGWFSSQHLPANQFPEISKQLSFLTVIGVLSGFGYMIAKTVAVTKGKVDYLHGMATTDALTGLLNRRELNLRLSAEFARAKRHKTQLSFAIFDIDFFKKINDNYGHPAGDAILQEMGKVISDNTRTSDIAARYGGEEFALILPETPLAKAHEFLDRIRHIVEKERFNKDGKPIKVTISAGVAQLDLTDKSPLAFCERADKALYKAKEGGRNRVERADAGIPKIILESTINKKAV